MIYENANVLYQIKLTSKEKDTYNTLKEKLITATHPEEVSYYEEQIHKLLDKAEYREKNEE